MLFGWGVLAVVLPLLIGLGWAAMSFNQSFFAQISFSIAALVFISKFIWWITLKNPFDASKIQIVIISFVVIGIAGVMWALSIIWVQQSINQSNITKPVAEGQKLPPTTAELENNLKEQIRFLKRSSEYFDQGMEDEAKRIASNLHILFVGTGDSPSLLKQMRIQDEMILPNTAPGDVKGNLAPYTGLVAMNNVDGKINFIPLCLLHPSPFKPKQTPFNEWWHTIILNDHAGIVYTREQLVIAVAEQDGGVSVTTGLDPSYVELARKNGIGWIGRLKGGGEKPMLGVELHSIRQIGWEVLEAFRQSYPQYFSK